MLGDGFMGKDWISGGRRSGSVTGSVTGYENARCKWGCRWTESHWDLGWRSKRGEEKEGARSLGDGSAWMKSRDDQ